MTCTKNSRVSRKYPLWQKGIVIIGFRYLIAYATSDLECGLDRVSKAYQDPIDRGVRFYYEAFRIVYLPLQNNDHNISALNIFNVSPSPFVQMVVLLEMFLKLVCYVFLITIGKGLGKPYAIGYRNCLERGHECVNLV